MDELQWVNYLKKTVPKQRDVVVGIGDDCAVVKSLDGYQLFTSDLFIEGIHFRRRGADFKKLGMRAAARALSDIVACAGVPRYLGVSAGVPRSLPSEKVKNLFLGVREYCRNHKVRIVGGDTALSSHLFLDIWAVGHTKKYVLRSTAKTGDYIFVTGRLGQLKFDEPFELKTSQIQDLVRRYKVTAMIDISDGLILDLYRILRASKKAALLFYDRIPVTKGAKDLYRGEDYQLIFTVAKSEDIRRLEKKYFLIGRIRRREFGYKMERNRKRKDVDVEGYLHF